MVHGAALANQNAGFLREKDLGTLLEKFRNGNPEANVVTEILNIVKDVRDIQSNQVRSKWFICVHIHC